MIGSLTLPAMSGEQRSQHRPLLGEERSPKRHGGPSTMASMQEAERVLMQFQGLFGKPEGAAGAAVEAKAETSGKAEPRAEERPLARLRPPATPAQATNLPPTGSAAGSTEQATPTAHLVKNARTVPVDGAAVSASRPSDRASSFGPSAAALEVERRKEDLAATPATSVKPGEDFKVAYTGKAPDFLVFRGGGTSCTAYAGVVRRLEEAKMLRRVSTLIGTSGGAQAAALVAFGYTGQELDEALREAPHRKLLDYAGFPCGACRNFMRLFRHYGVCKGAALEGFLDGLFKKKFGRSRCTFQELYQWTGKELHLGAFNMTTQELEFLDRRTHPDMPVCVAARASSSVPVLFRPVRMGDALYVGGGFEGNLPISAFHSSNQVLTVNLVAGRSSQTKKPPANFIQFLTLKEFAQGSEGLTTSPQRASALSSQGIDVLDIDIGKASSFDAERSAADYDELAKRGYEAVARYLRPMTE